MRRFTLIALIFLALLAACGGDDDERAAGRLAVDDVTANLALPSDTGAIYLHIHNETDRDETLRGATVPGCAAVEIHDMIMDGDVMKMRPVDGGVPIPAGETVKFRHGGLHMMCIGKTADFAVGASVPVTLEFANAGAMEVTAEIIDPTDSHMEMDDDD